MACSIEGVKAAFPVTMRDVCLGDWWVWVWVRVRVRVLIWIGVCQWKMIDGDGMLKDGREMGGYLWM